MTSALSRANSERERVTGMDSRVEDLEVLVEMGTEEGDADTLAEAERDLAKLKKDVGELEVRTLLNGEWDAREAVVTIRSGAGGVDAADFAEMLMRMYPVSYTHLDVYKRQALDAADALDEATAYRSGLSDAVVLSSATVKEAAAAYLLVRPKPEGVRAWGIAPGTGALNGDTAVVVLDATVELPLTGGLLSALGKEISVHVEAKARAPLLPVP